MVEGLGWGMLPELGDTYLKCCINTSNLLLALSAYKLILYYFRFLLTSIFFKMCTYIKQTQIRDTAASPLSPPSVLCDKQMLHNPDSMESPYLYETVGQYQKCGSINAHSKIIEQTHTAPQVDEFKGRFSRAEAARIY